MQTFELGMKQGHWLKSFNRWEISALSPHHLESHHLSLPRTEGIPESHLLPKPRCSQANRDKLMTPPPFFFFSSHQAKQWLIWPLVSKLLWLLCGSVFFFFWQFSMLVSGSQIAYIKHLVSPCVYCHQWKHLQLYEFGKCWMRYVIIMMHRK